MYVVLVTQTFFGPPQVFAVIRKFVVLKEVASGSFWKNDFAPSPGLIGSTRGVCPTGDMSKWDGDFRTNIVALAS